MILNKGYIHAAALAAASILSGCSGENNDTPLNPDDVTGKDVTLSLNIMMSEFPQSKITRAQFPDSDDMSFEGPVSDYEKARTLRVLIVHAEGDMAGVVEHNRMVMTDPGTGAIINDNLRFKVSSGEKKKIYLFANEAAVNYDFSAIKEGEPFPENEVADARISRRSGAAFIDNSQSSVEKTYVPMSEVFEIDVPVPDRPEDFFRIENLFVTRSTLKFSFHFSTAPDYPAEGVSVTGVRIYGLANECYYLPQNTIYDPGKYSPSANASGGRYITSFTTPADVTYSDYMFAPFSPIEIKEGMDVTLTPYVYFPESKRKNGTEPFRVSVVLDNGTELLTPRSLSLEDIPRNTHVKINIEMRSTDADASVILLPYTGIVLEPDFGL